MANPLPNEKELYERIKNEKITVHPVIWELLSHHIGNDLCMVTAPLEMMLDKKYPIPLTEDKAKNMLKHAFLIKELIFKLREATGRGGIF